MSDTPRTDAIVWDATRDMSDIPDLCMQLERENARLREAIKWAEPYVPKVCETRRMIDDILSNVPGELSRIRDTPDEQSK